MNPKYLRFGASLFPLSADKSRKRLRSIVLFFHYYLFLKLILSATKKNRIKAGGRSTAWESEIVPDRHVFVSIVGQEIEEKVPHVLSVVPDHL